MNERPAETTEHLTCPWCQYDLFGLPTAGNIVRCPECGNRSDLRLLRIPPKERAAKLRGMESLPAACSGLAFFVIIFALMGIPWLVPHRALRVEWTFTGISLACGASWALCARAYLHRYQFVLGAARVLVAFHACLWLFVIGVCFAWGGLCGAAMGGGQAMGLIACMVGMIALVVGGWLYKWARGILGQMYQQLASRERRGDL